MDNSNSQITHNGGTDNSSDSTTKSSAALPCGMPKWLSRITGQHQNHNATLSTSQARSLGSSFSDPSLIGIGCTPPRSNHLILVGSSDGKPKTKIVENTDFSSNNYDMQHVSTSSTILVNRENYGISISASNTPLNRRRVDSYTTSGSQKRTWTGSGSGGNNLNFSEALSPSADSDFYHHMRERNRSSENHRNNESDINDQYNTKHVPIRGEHVAKSGVASSRAVKEHEFKDITDLKEKMAKVVLTGPEFPVATKESLDGLKKGAMTETDDNLFDMDEYSAPSEETNGVTTSTPGADVYMPHGDEIENTGKMTLTQKILEKGIPQNWFFQSSDMEEDRNSSMNPGRSQLYNHNNAPRNLGHLSNGNHMRELNAWAPQNL